MAAQYEKDPLITQAETAVANTLGLQQADIDIGVANAIPGQDDGNVIRISGSNAPDKKPAYIKLSMHLKGSDLSAEDAEALALPYLQKLAPVAAIAKLTPDEKIAAAVLSGLTQAVQGTDFNTELFKWSGFNPEVEKKNDWQLRDHTISWAENNGYGIEFRITFPTDGKEDSSGLVEKTEKQFKERAPEILQVLIKQTEKATKAKLAKEGKSEAEIAAEIEKIKPAMEALEIHPNRDGETLKVTIRSPRQQEAAAKVSDTYRQPDNGSELMETNPLNALSAQMTETEHNPPLLKVLSRAFLFHKKEEGQAVAKPVEEFPLIAGRRDMRRAIEKELHRVGKLNEETQKLLDSDLFKRHGVLEKDGEKDTVLPTPITKKDPAKPDTIDVYIKVDADKKGELIGALAGMQAAPAATAETAAAAAPEAPDTSPVAKIGSEGATWADGKGPLNPLERIQQEKAAAQSATRGLSA